MEGYNESKMFRLLYKEFSGIPLTLAGTSFKEYGLKTLSLTLLIGDTKEAHESLINGIDPDREEWSPEYITGNGSVKPLMWICKQMVGIIIWAKQANFDTIDIDATDSKRFNAYSGMIRRILNRYFYSQALDKNIIKGEYEDGEPYLEIHIKSLISSGNVRKKIKMSRSSKRK